MSSKEKSITKLREKFDAINDSRDYAQRKADTAEIQFCEGYLDALEYAIKVIKEN
jgi:hypothetical protein